MRSSIFRRTGVAALLMFLPAAVHARDQESWSLSDLQRGYDVRLHPGGVLLRRQGGADERILTLDPAAAGPTRTRWFGKKGDVQFDQRKGQVFLGKHPVARLIKDGIRFEMGSGQSYDIRLRSLGRKRQGRFVWRVTVFTDKMQPVARGEAIHLAKKKLDKKQARAHILSTVRLYLAWREMLDLGQRELKPGEGDLAKLPDDQRALGEAVQTCWGQGLQRNPAFAKGGKLCAAWKGDKWGRLMSLSLGKNPFRGDRGFALCVHTETRRFEVKWSGSGKACIELKPAE